MIELLLTFIWPLFCFVFLPCRSGHNTVSGDMPVVESVIN